MDSTFGGGGFTQSGVEAKRESKTEGTLPVFIKQVHQQKDPLISLWGFEFKMITTVAIVRNVEHSSTKISYELEDMTGTISGHVWVEDVEAPPSHGININTYVRVIGAIRQQGDTKSLMVYKIYPVEGINEVNTHFLEVLNARYQSEEYFRGGSGQPTNDVRMTDVGATSMQATQGNTQGTTMKDGKTQAVYKAIQASAITHAERGANRHDLYRTFPHINENEMIRILDSMLEDGHIYSTIDSDHFLACF